jgi:hypothetical protein
LFSIKGIGLSCPPPSARSSSPISGAEASITVTVKVVALPRTVTIRVCSPVLSCRTRLCWIGSRFPAWWFR